MYNNPKWQKSKLIRPIRFSASMSGPGTSGLAKGVVMDIIPLQPPYTAPTLLDEVRKILDLNRSTPTAYATGVIASLPLIHWSISSGKLIERDKNSLISLGWRVTPIRRKTVN